LRRGIGISSATIVDVGAIGNGNRLKCGKRPDGFNELTVESHLAAITGNRNCRAEDGMGYEGQCQDHGLRCFGGNKLSQEGFHQK